MAKRPFELLDLMLVLGFILCLSMLVAWLALCIGVDIGEHYRW